MLKFLSQLFKNENVSQDHKAFFEAIDSQLNTLNHDSDLLSQEMRLLTAEDEWLDIWGSKFGISRRINESDSDYLERILSVMEDKVTIPAIIKAVKKVLGDNTIISIYEPYNDLAYFNVSKFSGRHRYPDSEYYRTHVIDVSINKPITQELVNFVNTVKPSGVSVRFTYKPTPDISEVVIDGTEDEPIKRAVSTTSSLKIKQISDPDSKFYFSGKEDIWFSRERIMDSEDTVSTENTLSTEKTFDTNQSFGDFFGYLYDVNDD